MFFAAALASSVAGCGGASSLRPAAGGENAASAVTPVDVSDAEFAAHTYRLLLDPGASKERTGVLVGVVRRQLSRAAQRFELSGEEVGLRALLGGLLLVRAGEHRPELLNGGAGALSAGAAEVARLGQEGYSVALYSMLVPELTPGAARAEVEAHLKAIEQFGKATQGGGPVQSAGAIARVAVQRALLLSTPEALTFARERLVSWIRRALDSNVAEQPIRSNVERDEALETFRAIRGGAIALVALQVRHGDPRGALTAIDEADLERLLPPELRDHLERAADEQSAESWAELYRLFESAAASSGSPIVFDAELMAGAAWGAALELFRSEPGALPAAMPLAAQLVKYGMAEVASLVLASAVGKAAPAEHVGAALNMVLNAVVVEDAAGQLQAARRTYAAAEPLMQLAESRTFAGNVAPSPARLRYVMAAIETRHAELARARPLLERALAAEASLEAYSMLASIERQQKRTEAALAALAKVVELSRQASDPIAECEALFQKFEILRDAGRQEAAAAALAAALVRSIEIQRVARPGPSQARVERLLARIIEQYGERAAVHRATERAFAAAGGDIRQLSATILDRARRSLVRSDLQSARAATQRALEAGLGPDEMVYVAVWQFLLENKLNARSDGLVEEALATLDEESVWPLRLRAWTRGKLSDSELRAAAKSAAERTEANFYVAMAAHARGRPEAQAGLREVADSPAIDLMEVGIARELIAPPHKYALPVNVTLP